MKSPFEMFLDKYGVEDGHAGDITCVRCGAILSTSYTSDRGIAESTLYTHECPDQKVITEVPQ